MTDDTELLKKRFLELYKKSDGAGIYCFTDFLGLMEQSAFGELRSVIPEGAYTAFGGTAGTERVIIRFGREDEIGYPCDFPITCLKIEPKNMKFADKLSHRDFLGALMNLGIDRATLGDIAIIDNVGYLFCRDTIAPYIKDELKKIKHTDVSVAESCEIPSDRLYRTEQRTVQVNGERLDAIIARVFGLSRDDSAALFRKGLVFVGGRLTESVSFTPRTGDTVSVRGYGRFIYRGFSTLTRKGKKNVVVDLYL